MFIKELLNIHIKDMLDLDREVNGVNKYSKEIRELAEDNKCTRSFGVFKAGNLIAFFIVKKEGKQEKEYVFDNDYEGVEILCTVSKSQKALITLLLTAPEFLNRNMYTLKYIRVKVEQHGYRFWKRAAEKLTPVFKAVKVNSYHDGVYDLTLTIGEISPQHIFYQILYRTFGEISTSCVDYKEILNNVLPYMNYNSKTYSLEEILKYKKTMIKLVTQRNLEFLNMLGSEYRIMLEFKDVVYGDKPESYFKSIEELGYTFKKKDCFFRYKDNYNLAKIYNNRYYWHLIDSDERRMVGRYKHITLDSIYYNGTLSYYRHILKKHLSNFYKTSANSETRFYMFDKYGCNHIEFSTLDNVHTVIPMFNRNTFNNYINKIILEQNVYKECIDVYGLTPKVVKNSNYLYTGSKLIKKLAGEDEVFKYLNRIANVIQKTKDEQLVSNDGDYDSEYIESYCLHDWYYPIVSIFDYETKVFLTKGAYKKILTLPQNQIIRLDNKLKQIVKLSKKINIKETRKLLSKCIRVDGNFDEIFDKINSDIDKRWLRNNKIDAKTKIILDNFLERMNKYTDNITAVNLFRMFGKTRALSIINGNFEGLFTEKDFLLSKEKLGLFIKDCIGKRGLNALVKNPFKLYNKLNKVHGINDIITGNIPDEKVQKILNIVEQQYNKIPKDLYLIDKFKGKIEKKCSPEFLVAGDASVCCMSFGANNARIYAKEKGFGIYNIYYKNRIIANSVLWINDAYNCLVIDNIEVHPNYTRFNKYIMELYFKMIDDLMKQYNLDFTVQGLSYNDLTLWKKKYYSFSFEKFNAREVEVKNFYTDAKEVCVVSLNTSKDELLNILKNKGLKFEFNKTKNASTRYDADEIVLVG